jgi:PAP2 superfamily
MRRVRRPDSVRRVAAERGFKRGVRDAAPVAVVLALCPLVAAMAPGPAVALQRALDLIGVERSLGLFFEPSVHAWFAARPRLMGMADLGYATVHLPVMLAVLSWAWFARPAAFPRLRNAFVVTQSLLVVGYVLVPMAPPRMVPSLGYQHASAAGLSGLDRVAMSPYAAMPSGHAAFAVLAAGTVICLSRRPLVRLVAAMYPVAVLFEIVGTGNHIWLDAAAGAAVAALGFGLVCAIESLARSRAASGDPVGEGAVS